MVDFVRNHGFEYQSDELELVGLPCRSNIMQNNFQKENAPFSIRVRNTNNSTCVLYML
jgi:hypothetical protein